MFVGGFFSDVDDVAHEKNPVPPKAWGSGGEAPGSTTTFNIDMHVDIHLNIDCQFGI
jgi:hypothetical protein